MFYSLFLITFIFFIQVTFVSATEGNTFSVMSYNVENLFDTTHDVGKNDYEMLPLKLKRSQYSKETKDACITSFGNGNQNSRTQECINLDWNEKVLLKKVNNLLSIISNYKNGDNQRSNHKLNLGPDIVVLPEIENISVMNLILNAAKKYGYRSADVLEDSDSRGIDVGILSKHPIVFKKIHRPKQISEIKRGVYQYDVKIGRRIVTILGNHWPSLNNDLKLRNEMANLFYQVVKSSSKADIVIAAGDFNAHDHEEPNIFKNISNIVYDARHEAIKLGVAVFPGSHKYRGVWSTLDRILVKKQSLNNGNIIPRFDTFEIVVSHQQVAPWPVNFSSNYFSKNNQSRNENLSLESLVPLRFHPKVGLGYSDHLPIVMKFSIR